MQFHCTLSRAGLVALSLLVFVVSFSSCTPIPFTSVRANEAAPFTHTLSKHSSDARIGAFASQDGGLIGAKYVTGILASSTTKIPNTESSLSRRSKAGNAFKKIGEGIKHAAQKVGGAVKTAAKKVGEGVKKAAEFVKKEAPVVAKFGLKVASTVQSVAAKAANFIPGVGKIASKALKAESAVTNAASNAIHAKLPPKLDKGTKVMDKIRNPVGGAAGKALNAVLRREEEELVGRDTLEWAEFESREYEALEERDYELEERDYELEERDYELEEREELDEALYSRQWNEWEDWE